jgi:exodeoxyribonuclease V
VIVIDNFELNRSQKMALEMGCEWWNDKHEQVFQISGLAGTGKSTIPRYLIDKMGLTNDNVAFVTYTGKAALALSRKGCPTKTIHSTIYSLEFLEEDTGDSIEENKIKKKRRYTPHFVRKPSLAPETKLIVIDEASMVDEKIGKDLEAYGIPILAVGDLSQLGPIYGKPYFLSRPNITLTEIMRQLENDPIIKLSHMALRGERIQRGRYGPNCKVVWKDEITDVEMVEYDIIICGLNKTRMLLNNYIRENIYGRNPTTPYINDKVICRRNNWGMSLDELYLINGMIGYIHNIRLESFDRTNRTVEIDFRPEFTENYFMDVKIDLEYLFNINKDTAGNAFSTTCYFEWGNAITCHSSQGSQYKNVIVISEPFGSIEQRRSLLYTAITRAESGLLLAV